MHPLNGQKNKKGPKGPHTKLTNHVFKTMFAEEQRLKQIRVHPNVGGHFRITFCQDHVDKKHVDTL